MIRHATSALLVAVLAVAPSVASAQSIEEFETCRAGYEARDFARAVQCFERVVGADETSRDSLVLESRKYLGAAYLFLGRRDAALHQFELLLRQRPDYVLDPVLFPAAIQEAFNAVRDRLADEVRVAAERRGLEERLAREQARSAALLELAEEPVELEVEASRWAALVPWGVGQFLNGDDGLGWFFFIGETVLLGAAFGALAWHDSLMAQVATAFARTNPGIVEQANPLLTAATVTNWVSLGALAVMALAGVVEAQLAFVPSRRVRQRRDVPDELREGLDTEPAPPQEAGPTVQVIPFGIRF